MKIYKLGALAVLPLFLLGCPSPEEEPAFTDEDWATEERAPEIGHTETVGLGEVEDSGVAGDARFTVITQNETEVMIEVEDGAPNSSYQVAIHEGTCDNPGQQRHALEAIRTNDQGVGASSTTLNVQLGNVMDGRHVVAVHGPRTAEADADADADTDVETDPETDMDPVTGERPVACGAISEYGGGLGW